MTSRGAARLRLATVLALGCLPRAASKGCFTEDALVTMADGTRKLLQDVRVGDEVRSYDDVAHQTATSKVMAVPTYFRNWTELAEVSLPSASLHATEDHPFWSRRQGRLVSLHPNNTKREYDLEAGLMEAGEELEGESQELVLVSAIQRLVLSHSSAGKATALPQVRSLRDVNSSARVMTLCLEPHHWFYVHGVRVHNKGGGGCFAPWTPILMGDGAHKRIEDVRVADRVTSWDERAGRLAQATVVGIDVFPSRSMLQVSFGARQLEAARQLRAAEFPAPDGEAMRRASLIVTRDHPVYSVRSRGLVSMEPNTTLELYSMTVGQMQEKELLHHHQGHLVPAMVRSWEGNTSQVMTLRLDRHHWFYANGVRVHNKGSGGRGRGGGGGGGGGSPNLVYYIFGIVSLLLAIGTCGYFHCKFRKSQQRMKAELDSMKEARESLSPDQGTLPYNAAFSGTYSENGQTKTTCYTLAITNGIVSGSSQDDEGVAQVQGVVNQPEGKIHLLETREDEGVRIEIAGSVQDNHNGSFTIQADYLSSYQTTRGRLNLRTAVEGAVVSTAAAYDHSPIVQAQVVGQTYEPGRPV